MFKKSKFKHILTNMIALTMLFSMTQPSVVSAQSGDGIKRLVNTGSGRVSFIGPEKGRVLSASRALGTFARPQDPALALVNRYAPEFGLKEPLRDLTEMSSVRSDDGRITVRYQQKYQGIPVMGGELIVNTNEDGDLYSMNGEVSLDISLQPQPVIDSPQAAESALQAMAKWYQKDPADFVASEPGLWILDESLLRPSTRPVALVWRMEVTSAYHNIPLRELVLVDAHKGNISLHFNQVDTAWHSTSSLLPGNGTSNTINNRGLATLGSPLVSTYTGNDDRNLPLPGVLLCDQTQPNCTGGTNPHADSVHKHAIGSYNFFASKFNRDSMDNNGMTIISTVQFCEADSDVPCPYSNAFWDGTQMVFGGYYGFALSDDIVAHEFTHGVTQYQSDLFYYYQSGAISESISDLWGEYYDQDNGVGNDSPGVRWLVGEDTPGLGAIRSMNNPTLFGDPDKMSSPYYAEDEGDSGGVHANSGINNKVVSLLVDGGSFNGKSVSALNWVKTSAIYYEVNANLLVSGSDYSDLYYALPQACTNLIGQHGITSGDCVEVQDAVAAVEMNIQPSSNFNTHAPLCNVGAPHSTVFFDDLESGSANWEFGALVGSNDHWQYDSPYGPYTFSGEHMLYADDFPDEPTDTYVKTKNTIPIPPGAFMHFSHAYGFEDDSEGNYDGGVLEYSANNGVTWQDAGPLFINNGYTGMMDDRYGNPLGGRVGFVKDSHGYISSRLDLQSLANKNVTFRWRMGLDESYYDWGWWLDDITIYTCVSSWTISGNAGAGDVVLSYVDGTAKTVTSQTDGSYSLKVSPGWSGTVTPSHPCYTFNPASQIFSNVTSNRTQNYTATLTPSTVCVVSVLRTDPSPTGKDSVGYTVKFTKDVTGVDTNDFDLKVQGITGAVVSNVSGSGNTRSVTVSTGSGNGTIRLDVVGLATGNYSNGETYLILRDQTFGDVFTTYWAWQYIERLYNAGITGGCGNNSLIYCPEATVTRAQMAVFLLRGISGVAYTPPAIGVSTGYSDVPVNYWSATWIKQLAVEGITGGCGVGSYCPENPVTRAQMAVFLLRAKHGSSYSPPPVGGSTGFGDVPTNYWAAPWIKQLVAEGITSGCGGGNYCPEQSVSRAQMAVFLVKTFGLP